MFWKWKCSMPITTIKFSLLVKYTKWKLRSIVNNRLLLNYTATWWLKAGIVETEPDVHCWAMTRKSHFGYNGLGYCRINKCIPMTRNTRDNRLLKHVSRQRTRLEESNRCPELIYGFRDNAFVKHSSGTCGDGVFVSSRLAVKSS
jgi:hypothetical protein